jgi:hypothetical protein
MYNFLTSNIRKLKIYKIEKKMCIDIGNKKNEKIGRQFYLNIVYIGNSGVGTGITAGLRKLGNKSMVVERPQPFGFKEDIKCIQIKSLLSLELLK